MSIPFAEAALHERNVKAPRIRVHDEAGLQFTRDHERTNARNEILGAPRRRPARTQAGRQLIRQAHLVHCHYALGRGRAGFSRPSLRKNAKLGAVSEACPQSPRRRLVHLIIPVRGAQNRFARVRARIRAGDGRNGPDGARISHPLPHPGAFPVRSRRPGRVWVGTVF
jgi:hypothetical protein